MHTDELCLSPLTREDEMLFFRRHLSVCRNSDQTEEEVLFFRPILVFVVAVATEPIEYLR